MSRRNSVIPTRLIAHRTVTQVEGVDTTPPAVDHAGFQSSNKYPIVRVYAEVAFTGGVSPSVDLGVYARQLDSSAPPAYKVARAPSPDSRWATGTLRITGNDKVAFDILAEGDDFLVLVEAVNGAPATWSVVLRASAR